jgi:glycosyltransferase involved in cell wall biosynthesis
MTENPKVSFIIPCYNDGQLTQNAIASVENCPSGSYEIIVVDDGSTDEVTLQLMSDLQASRYCVLSQENKGPAAARNTGIKAAAGEYILPLDSDNKIRPDFIAKARAILNRQPEIGVVYSGFQYFGLAEHVCKNEPFNIRRMLYRNHIDTCALYRKALWEDCGGYDEHQWLKGFEDWDFWLNAYSRGWQFLHVDMVGFDYALREGSQLSKTKIPENWEKAEKYLYSKHAVLIKKYYDDYYRWDYHRGELRRRPLRTLFRLVTGALSPKLHDRIYKIG